LILVDSSVWIDYFRGTSTLATRCIEGGFALLYSDKDFDPFVAHLGLRSALSKT
jgi:predicted nucleic acid-binding protein